ncbi:ShlB/FhaC/HecB family hemolysin secretion/activation protein [Janthinobacterium sp. SUN137]|uniref:ShlB/FhaC/HecB family hemolysin secretion/activation protein n=1 Tax=Janthinobacterium sp. SUN137 TaxID=3014789 RepID=UPI0027136854|nr:ShlB/FhaC/HecB family hemolysin secretion/activation protein [Janthinobacterium sp. SUN137]MDO8040331.1 ShlB/FhaC/HecB family hemolysin secretion/activation protein [Janthinobacterium sp. SUN137]
MTTLFKQPLLMKPLYAALLLVPLDAYAADPQTTPNAGSILQQLQPAIPAVVKPNAPTLEVKPKGDASLPPSQPIPVKGLRIDGNTAFSTQTLHALVADQEGKSLTLPQLDEVAGRITAYYQDHGFPMTRAIIPVQSIIDGVILIQVVEAHYGKVRLSNRSEVSDALLHASLAPLSGGQLIADAELNRALLLLSDVPGVGVNAILKPGSVVGTADMDVEARYNRVPLANIAVDNYGNRYIGRTRLSGNFNIVNPFHHGDILSVNLISTGEGMNYGRVGYDTLLNGQGTRIGGAYSALHYKLGGTARALDANGTAKLASLWVKQPLLRTKQYNLYAQLQYDAKNLRDHVDVSSLHTDRQLHNWIASVSGDLRDGLLGGGMSIASLGWTSGRGGFDNPSAAAADAATARTGGGYSKWNANIARLQGLTLRDSLYINLSGQWADGNLDSAEKMTAGGPYTVRAYDSGAISGDTGYAGTVELRHELEPLLLGKWQVLAFIDCAYVKVNRHPWTTAENNATLSGAGIGLNWAGPDQWRASVSVATRLGAAPSMLTKPSSVRAWLVASKGF